MPISVAPGHPTYSGSPTHYIPAVYAGKTRVKYYDRSTVTAIANTDYEGQIKNFGDTVRIRTVPTVTIRDYYKGMTFTYESLQADAVELTIDNGKFYAFGVDAVDEKQADIVLSDKFIEDASHGMETAVDSVVYADFFASAHADNQGTTAGAKSAAFNLGVSGTPLAVTKSNILDVLVDLGTVLEEQSVPDDGHRWVVLPPLVCGLISKSDLKSASFSGDDKSLLFNGGYVGSVNGFRIHKSNLLTDTADGSGFTAWNIPFGHKDGLTYAAQLVKNESLKLQNNFGQGYRGLQVFGYKVTYPKAIGWMYARVA